jgi:hypothetical protein
VKGASNPHGGSTGQNGPSTSGGGTGPYQDILTGVLNLASTDIYAGMIVRGTA